MGPSTASSADPKPRARIRDKDLLRRLHLRWRECALADGTCAHGLSLHHISKHPRDDVEGNLVMLCGSGTTGHHGRIEAWNETGRRALGTYLLLERPDVLDYIANRYGNVEGAAWLEAQKLW